MDFITSDGVRLEYDDVGTGRPVVILTGLGGSRAIWLDQVKALTTAGYRVLNIDARNQGASQHTTKGRSIARHALDLAEFIAKFKLESPILLGNSMGAATMFSYVSLYGSRQIGALIDVDQSPKMINDADWSYGYQQLTWENFHTVLEQPLGRATYQRLADETYLANKAALKEHPYDAALNQPFLFDHALKDWRGVITTLECPFLIIAGEKSPYFDHDFAPKMANSARHGSFQVIKNSGHIVMAEQPRAFNEALFDFLAANDL
ncbi:hypothetical protein LFYK43_12770 [Ligilactobacillus salitolerans]|uniref:AB hydrolase-1 domain-containing protein n=1 Tax=Ligilactobacillus salitolerans TaxID=1808352 RepID=A0A401ITH1_9LACO|nr:alpha/beta hydrolase [Ligilactobacillus salitolerans]GBG94818.1 hypothetical protein LFYK43_12770 [Ligilactobacillus salitolerans]